MPQLCTDFKLYGNVVVVGLEALDIPIRHCDTHGLHRGTGASRAHVHQAHCQPIGIEAASSFITLVT